MGKGEAVFGGKSGAKNKAGGAASVKGARQKGISFNFAGVDDEDDDDDDDAGDEDEDEEGIDEEDAEEKAEYESFKTLSRCAEELLTTDGRLPLNWVAGCLFTIERSNKRTRSRLFPS